MLIARIQAGNSSSAQGEMPMPTSAVASPSPSADALSVTALPARRWAGFPRGTLARKRATACGGLIRSRGGRCPPCPGALRRTSNPAGKRSAGGTERGAMTAPLRTECPASVLVRR